ncbi:LysE family translocator [Pseudoalteromonas tunicata]|uniref:LysE family translocator n=1 Tax=Pseudoalteromonas tunicata TaxID=314281 RepID=UPI00273FB745|nr:LysE family translocator [Pseudoalteromonas tunicata]MDP5215042.1 LysE family translocator [Pseudoalteromonas tunicata]
MPDITLLLLFIPTSFLVSISPGMCMTLAMTLGMSVGLKRTFYMMWGELLGVATVATAAVLGVAALMLNYPDVFNALKWIGGAYLIFVGIQMWQSKGNLALSLVANKPTEHVSAKNLFSKGYLTAVSNPKGWAFTASLLPPFINSEHTLAPQLIALVFILLATELICMTLYASGGHGLRKLLASNGHVQLLNRISACLMMAVGVWLAIS